MVVVTATQTVHPKLKNKSTFSVFVRTKIQPNVLYVRYEGAQVTGVVLWSFEQ